MICPKCEANDWSVSDTRHRVKSIYRRRECKQCGAKFTTQETFAHNDERVKFGRKNIERIERELMKLKALLLGDSGETI